MINIPVSNLDLVHDDDDGDHGDVDVIVGVAQASFGFSNRMGHTEHFIIIPGQAQQWKVCNA